jgi:hypothetical protein
MENPHANGVKMTDWFAQLEAEKRPNLSNYLEGEFLVHSTSILDAILICVLTDMRRSLRTPNMHSLQLCRNFIQ